MNQTTGRRAVSMVLTALVAASLAATPALAADPVEVTFSSTGAEQEFVVPDGVTSIHVALIGGLGAPPNYVSLDGGHGAQVTADLAVTGGATLFVEVGGNGHGAFGGFNGGGNGAYHSGQGMSFGGGGASDLRTIAQSDVESLASRLVVAAGGGGAGSNANGGDAGKAGADAYPGAAEGGGAGTASTGGAGGFGINVSGGDGSAGTGGQGAYELCVDGWGGGGGGGWFDGGGGGGIVATYGTVCGLVSGYNGNGAGGGGGSSHTGDGTNAAVTLDDTGVPSITITYAPSVLPSITFTSGPPPAGQVGQQYSFQYTATGDDGITFAGGQLPAGLTLDTTGLLSGYPTTAGAFPADVTASGLSGASTSREDFVAIAPFTHPEPYFTSGPPPSGQVGQPYSFQYTASGDDLITFAGGQLPPGLTLGTTGLLSGYPTAAGTFPADVTATGFNGGSTSREDFVSIAPAPLLVPNASVAPTSIDFSGQIIGTTSASHVVTLSNTGDGPLMIGPVNIGGGNSADFGKAADSCSGQALAPGASCGVSVTFSPSGLGPRSATLAFADNAAGSPQNVSLAGTGVAPMADLGIGLATAAARKGSPFTYVITVTNHGPSSATGVVVTDSLPSTTRFVSVSSTKGTCTAPPAGSTGTITCSIGTLAATDTSVTRIAVTIELKKGTLSNTVSVSSTTADPNLANNSATITTR